jgi:hypothetical protein
MTCQLYATATYVGMRSHSKSLSEGADEASAAALYDAA